MKRFDGRGALAGLLMGWILCAGPAEAATGPITCGDTLGAGRHVLTGDIICGATDFQALTLLDGAILDLNGAVIQSGPVESFGIVVDGDGVTIEGPGALVGFQIAVSVQTPVADFELKGVEIDGTRVGRGNGSGVVLNGVSNAVVEGNLFVDVGTAVDVRVGAGLTVPASGNRIVRNGIERAGLGVTVCGFGASGNLVADNAFEEVQVGVSVEEDAEGNVLANNDVAEAAVAGFQVLGASRNVLFGGTVFDSSRGVVVDGLRSTFRSCRSNPAGTVTERNAVFGLTASRNLVGVEVGSASVTDPVARTTVVASDLRDNEIGASLGANSTRSRVLFNDLRGNAAPVQDAGTGNRVFANRL